MRLSDIKGHQYNRQFITATVNPNRPPVTTEALEPTGSTTIAGGSVTDYYATAADNPANWTAMIPISMLPMPMLDGGLHPT